MTFALGLLILVYQGPAQPFIRGYLGDVLAVAFLHFAIRWLTKASLRASAVMTAVVAVALEASQLIPGTLPVPGLDVVVGRTFDGQDLVWYALGLAGAVSVDWGLARSGYRATASESLDP